MKAIEWKPKRISWSIPWPSATSSSPTILKHTFQADGADIPLTDRQGHVLYTAENVSIMHVVDGDSDESD